MMAVPDRGRELNFKREGVQNMPWFKNIMDRLYRTAKIWRWQRNYPEEFSRALDGLSEDVRIKRGLGFIKSQTIQGEGKGNYLVTDMKLPELEKAHNCAMESGRQQKMAQDAQRQAAYRREWLVPMG